MVEGHRLVVGLEATLSPTAGALTCSKIAPTIGAHGNVAVMSPCDAERIHVGSLPLQVERRKQPRGR